MPSVPSRNARIPAIINIAQLDADEILVGDGLLEVGVGSCCWKRERIVLVGEDVIGGDERPQPAVWKCGGQLQYHGAGLQNI